MDSPPSCADVAGKAALEILGFVVLILPMAYIYVFTQQYAPYQRYAIYTVLGIMI